MLRCAVQAFRHLAKETNTLLLPAQAGDPSSMVAQALGVYRTVSQQQLPQSGDDGSSDGSNGSSRNQRSATAAAAGLGANSAGGSGGSGVGAGRRYSVDAGRSSSSNAAAAGSGSSSLRSTAAAAGMGGAALGGAALTGSSGSWLPDSPVFSLRSVLDD